jgi:hypothetical protein
MNAFETLGLVPRPWLDPEVVAERHRAILQAEHPDVACLESGSAALANQARQRLSSPAAVLAHLLECHGEGWESAARAVPPALGDVFMKLAGPVQEAVRLRQEAEACESHLERAGLAEPALGVLEVLQELGGELHLLESAARMRVEALDRAWQRGERPWAALRDAATSLVFLERWVREVGDKQFQMAELAAGG